MTASDELRPVANRILCGDARDWMSKLPSESVHTIVTSPPYYLKRDYELPATVWGGTKECDHKWGRHSGCSVCGAWRGTLGQESTPDLYVQHIVEILREAKRVLRSDGTCWVVIGDSYAGGGGASGHTKDTLNLGRKTSSYGAVATGHIKITGLAAKNMVGIPWRVGLKLQEDGWILRAELIWAKGVSGQKEMMAQVYAAAVKHADEKTAQAIVAELDAYVGSCMPESGKTRPTYSHETILLLAKNNKDIYWVHPTKGGTRTRPRPDYKWQNRKTKVMVAEEPEGWRTDALVRKEWARINLWEGHDYFWDQDAIREPNSPTSGKWGKSVITKTAQAQGEHGASSFMSKEMSHEEVVDKYYTRGRKIRSVWAIPIRPFRGAHFACVDEETEILTTEGWKRYDRVKAGDTALSFNLPKQQLEWQPIQAVWIYDYDGEMVDFGNRDLSGAVTPNHRCLVWKPKGHSNLFLPRVVSASELRRYMKIPQRSKVVDDFTFEPGLSDDQIRLIGWLVTEGYFAKRGNAVSIYQSEKNWANVLEIRRLLHNLGFAHTESRRMRKKSSYWQHTWYVGVAGGERIRSSLTSSKRLETKFAFLPLRQASILFDTVRKGDGHLRKDDGRQSIIQKDAALLDVMQIIGLRLGYRGIIRPRAGQNGNSLYLTRKESTSLRGTDGRGGSIRRAHYKGKVWSVEIPNTFYYARRRGAPFITGNTFPERLVELMVKAGSSEEGVCSLCGAPYERVVEQGETDEEWIEQSVKSLSDKTEAVKDYAPSGAQNASETKKSILDSMRKVKMVGWVPTCNCNAGKVPATVLDMFAGSGTVPVVAVRLGRNFVGIDRNKQYCEMAEDRVRNETKLKETGAETSRNAQKAQKRAPEVP